MSQLSGHSPTRQTMSISRPCKASISLSCQYTDQNIPFSLLHEALRDVHVFLDLCSTALLICTRKVLTSPFGDPYRHIERIMKVGDIIDHRRGVCAIIICPSIKQETTIEWIKTHATRQNQPHIPSHIDSETGTSNSSPTAHCSSRECPIERRTLFSKVICSPSRASLPVRV